MTVGQAEYERVVLLSLLTDASNVLTRTKLEPAGMLLVETSRLGWSHQLVVEYLPEFARAVPLTSESVVSPAQNGDGGLWVKLPRNTVRDALEVYLVWFLERAMSSGCVHADATKQFRGQLVEVADGIARAVNEQGFEM